MIKLLGQLPRGPIWVACSGGVDSVVAVDFLRRTREVRIAFFDHGTPTSRRAAEFISLNSQFHGLTVEMAAVVNQRPPDQSWEEFWREERYRFLESLDGPVVTAHHLDDAVETYVWRMCHGRSDTVPYRRNNIIRPFLLTPKNELIDWAVRHRLDWVEDQTNQDTGYTRNHIRHRVLPELWKVNPGLSKIVAKLVEKSFNN